RADALRQLLDLTRGTRVDAIEHAVHQRRAILVHRQHAWTDGAGADGGDGRCRDPALRQHLPRDEGEIAPPILPGPVLRPAGLRHQHLVRAGGGRDDPATLVYDDALGLEGTNVDAKIVLHSRY